MINLVKPDSVDNRTVFAPLQSSGVHYAISKPFTEEQKNAGEKEKEKKESKLGSKIAKISIIAGFGVFAIMKGTSKSGRSKVNKFVDHLQEKITGLNKNQEMNAFQRFFSFSLNKIKSLTNFSKGLFNFAPFKDVLVMKGLKKVPILERISNRITNVFEKITIKQSRKAYDATFSKFDRMYTNFAEKNDAIRSQDLSKKINVMGTTKTAGEWVEKIEQKTKNIQTNFDSSFREMHRNKRLEDAKKYFDGVDKNGNLKPKNSIFSRVYDKIYGNFKGFLGDKNNYRTFISEELAAGGKFKFANDISMLKRKISNDVNDNYFATKKILSHIDSFIDHTDENSRVLIKNIKNNLEEYKKVSSSTPDTTINLLNQNTSKNLSDLDLYIKNTGKYDKEITKKLSDYIENANTLLKNNKRGEIQEILTIYKRLLPEAEYLKLKKDTYKTITPFNKAVDLESDKLFDKIRDFKLGSAPMDCLGVLTSLGVIGWGLSKADNKDQRISVALKYGIPAIGTVATTLYFTLALVSAGKSLVYGLIAGLIIDIFGVAADKARKKYQEKPLKLDNLPLPASIMPSNNKKAKLIQDKSSL